MTRYTPNDKGGWTKHVLIHGNQNVDALYDPSNQTSKLITTRPMDKPLMYRV